MINSTSNLRKASRRKAKIRLGISGPSGSGKTITALMIAYGITGTWDNIAVIDTESNSADLYANHTVKSGKKDFKIGEFNVLPLRPPFTPERYIDAIQDCEAAGMEVIIIDSSSHEWNGEGGIIEMVDNLKKSGNGGNAFTAGWSEATPRHNKFVQAMLSSPSHIIACMRSKVDYVLEANEKGKMVPKKMGLAPVQREGLDYEFTTHFDLNQHHMAKAMKDRTGLFIGRADEVPTVETGNKILQWCESGVDVPSELEAAIKQVKTCQTLNELKLLVKGFPKHILENDSFISAGKEHQDLVASKTNSNA